MIDQPETRPMNEGKTPDSEGDACIAAMRAYYDSIARTARAAHVAFREALTRDLEYKIASDREKLEMYQMHNNVEAMRSLNEEMSGRIKETCDRIQDSLKKRFKEVDQMVKKASQMFWEELDRRDSTGLGLEGLLDWVHREFGLCE
ncbi:hypothetical protein M011DRAFT_327785 [Sporormia fimetaria CBS 119925]|uniref:Uncharacterized protein n=1 Tax=Sporormia fimetaria CBS 119925 TaxID=1340428 RepID=A0A6A6VG12_9PLEO|nr:hypothetical protein M011DRAFT_327785 [Sporormia fimetaria CBS 119925]